MRKSLIFVEINRTRILGILNMADMIFFYILKNSMVSFSFISLKEILMMKIDIFMIIKVADGLL